MTRRKKDDDSDNIQPSETQEVQASEGVVDAQSTSDPVVVKDDELGERVVVSTGTQLDTSADTTGGASISQELTTVAPVVQSEPGDLDKTGNPYTIVDAGAVRAKELAAQPVITHSEWQAESAPEQKGASMVNPDDAEGKDYLYPTSFLHGIGIETCSECGEGLRTDTYGHILCPVNSASCPRLTAAEDRVSEEKQHAEDQASDRQDVVQGLTNDPDKLIQRRDEELRDHAQ